MLKRLPTLALAMLSLVFATSLRAGTLGSMLQSWDIDSTKNAVTLHLFNSSGKDITAYNITIKETYGEQVNEHQYYEDMVGVMLRIQDPTEIHRDELADMYHGNGTWENGTSHDQVLAVQPGLTGFEATLDVVVYADKTAETTNREALERAMTTRNAIAQTLQAASQAIKQALSNPTDESPHETAVKQIEALRKNWEDSHEGNFNAGAFDGAILDLDNAPLAAATLHRTLPDYLSDLASHNSRRASSLLEHAAPKVVEGAK
ncbi:MAG TPA: hypothetical protein VHM93_05010 [Candidatus Acidoferrum sp.]|nr:hypothetical protein [Candidatus Acidoferrum sp.]